MSYCSNCGGEVGETDRACPACGATFQSDPQGESPETGSNHLRDTDEEKLGVRAFAAAAVLSAVSLSVASVTLSTTPWYEMSWTDPVVVLLWAVAAVGLWTRSERGIQAGAAVFGLAAVVSAASFVLPLLGVPLPIGPFDPVTAILGMINGVRLATLQEGTTLAMRALPVAAFEVGGLLGALVSGGASAYLWENSRRLIESDDERTVITSES